MQFAPTIDVEATRRGRSYESVDLLSAHLRETGIRATLFVTPDVVENRPRVVSEFLEDGHHVGLHIHPARLGYDSDWLGEYSAGEIEEMLAVGLDVFEDTLSYKPTSFRAGRWEHSEALIDALSTYDFAIDASLRPDRPRKFYESRGVIETPLTTYANSVLEPLLSRWELESLPMNVDALLSNLWYAPSLYWATWRIRQRGRPNMLVAYHDYDLVASPLRRRIESYVKWASRSNETCTLGELDFQASNLHRPSTPNR